MTSFTYSYPDDSLLAAGKPARAVDIRSIRDIGPAIAEGADGAPRVMLAALPRLEAGTTVRLELGAASLTGTTSYASLFRIGLMQFGTIRVSGTLTGTANTTHYVRALRMRAGVGAELASASVAAANSVAWSWDLPVIPGDTVHLQVREAGSVSGTLTLSGVQMKTGGQDYWPAATDYPLTGNVGL